MRLAAPVSLSQLALLGIGVTDVILAGRVGTTDLAGVTLGNSAYSAIIFFFTGIAIANQPLVASLFGAGNITALRNQIFQSGWMALACGVTATVCVLFGAKLLGFLHVATNVLAIGTGYMEVIALGAIGMTLLMVFRTSLEAMNQTRVVLAINLLMFLLNIPLDLALLFGLWGFPELGGVGCAWASVTVIWASVLLQWLVLVFARKQSAFETRQFATTAQSNSNNGYAKTGNPHRVFLIDRTRFFWRCSHRYCHHRGNRGLRPMRWQLARPRSPTCCFWDWGKVLVFLPHKDWGAHKPHRSIAGIWFGINLSLVLAIVLSIIIVTFRFEIAGLYSKDINVINLAAQLLIWAAIFQLADALQITAICGLRAFKETRRPPLYQLFAFWLLAFPLGYGLGVLGWIPVLQGPQGFWLAMLIGLSVAAILITRKLRHVAQAVKARKYNPYVAHATL